MVTLTNLSYIGGGCMGQVSLRISSKLPKEERKRVMDVLTDGFRQRQGINIERIEQAFKLFETLIDILNEAEADVVCEFTQPFQKVIATVHVTNEMLTFNNTRAFKELCETASSWEVYPRTDNTIRMSFSLYGIER